MCFFFFVCFFVVVFFSFCFFVVVFFFFFFFCFLSKHQNIKTTAWRQRRSLTLTSEQCFTWWSVFGRANRVQLLDFCCFSVSELVCCLVSSCFISVIYLDLYVRCFDSLMSRGPSRRPNNFFVYMNHSRNYRVRLLIITNRSKAMLLLWFCGSVVTLWFILLGASCFKDFPCSLCFLFPFRLWSPCLGKRGLVCVLLVHLFFCFVRCSFCHFSLPLGVGGWLRSLDFSINFFILIAKVRPPISVCLWLTVQFI